MKGANPILLLTVIIAIILIYVLEGRPLIKSKQWKEFVTMGFLLGIALLLVVGKMINILSPLGFLDKLLFPIGKSILK